MVRLFKKKSSAKRYAKKRRESVGSHCSVRVAKAPKSVRKHHPSMRWKVSVTCGRRR